MLVKTTRSLKQRISEHKSSQLLCCLPLYSLHSSCFLPLLSGNWTSTTAKRRKHWQKVVPKRTILETDIMLHTSSGFKCWLWYECHAIMWFLWKFIYIGGSGATLYDGSPDVCAVLFTTSKCTYFSWVFIFFIFSMAIDVYCCCFLLLW